MTLMDKVGGGWDTFYRSFCKLVSEAYVMSLGVPFTIIKATGLTEGPGGGKLQLLTHGPQRPTFALTSHLPRICRLLEKPTTPKQFLQQATFPW